MEEPKDLGVKIGSPLEVFWTRVKKMAQQDMDDARNSILLNEEIVKVSEQKLKELE